MILAKVGDGDGGRSYQHRLRREVLFSGCLKMPRYDSSLGVGMLYSPEDAEIVVKGIKHKRIPQERIHLKPVSLLLQTMLAVGRKDFFNVQL